MKKLGTLFTDATCYENWMRFPIDVKFLWECVEATYKIMCGISESLGERRMKTMYKDVEKARLAYMKQRRHSKQQNVKMK